MFKRDKNCLEFCLRCTALPEPVCNINGARASYAELVLYPKRPRPGFGVTFHDPQMLYNREALGSFNSNIFSKDYQHGKGMERPP